MRPSILAVLLAILVGSAVPVRAADLAKIERTIAKEPVYKDKPHYCLLVFGAEAKFRVWVVRDGDVVYVDRSGNGDLAEEGKRFPVKRGGSNYRRPWQPGRPDGLQGPEYPVVPSREGWALLGHRSTGQAPVSSRSRCPRSVVGCRTVPRRTRDPL